MRLLLDTHALWWALFEPHHLKPRVADLISAVESEVHYSPLAVFELALKRSLGRFAFDHDELFSELRTEGFTEIPLRREHALRAGMLPRLHKDPFDRLLIGQALEEGMSLVTSDAMIHRYAVTTIAA